MTDKERILTTLFRSIYMKTLYDSNYSMEKYRAMQPSFLTPNTDKNALQPGDLVVGMTGDISDFTVGYIVEVYGPDNVLIRGIGSDQTCRYSNEHFMRVDKSILGYEILEGLQYQTYQKVRMAVSCFIMKLHSIDFKENICTIQLRKLFADTPCLTVNFVYTKDITVGDIVKLIESEERKE